MVTVQHLIATMTKIRAIEKARGVTSYMFQDIYRWQRENLLDRAESKRKALRALRRA